MRFIQAICFMFDRSQIRERGAAGANSHRIRKGFSRENRYREQNRYVSFRTTIKRRSSLFLLLHRIHTEKHLAYVTRLRNEKPIAHTCTTRSIYFRSFCACICDCRVLLFPPTRSHTHTHTYTVLAHSYSLQLIFVQLFSLFCLVRFHSFSLSLYHSFSRSRTACRIIMCRRYPPLFPLSSLKQFDPFPL